MFLIHTPAAFFQDPCPWTTGTASPAAQRASTALIYFQLGRPQPMTERHESPAPSSRGADSKVHFTPRGPPRRPCLAPPHPHPCLAPPLPVFLPHALPHHFLKKSLASESSSQRPPLGNPGTEEAEPSHRARHSEGCCWNKASGLWQLMTPDFPL